MRKLLAMTALILAGNAAAKGDTIRYSASALGLCESCRSYEVVVSPDGRGILRIKASRSAPEEASTFIAGKPQLRSFMDSLKPFRPKSGTSKDMRLACPEIMTEFQTIEVVWLAGDGRSSRLQTYLGCIARRNEGMYAALRSAPDSLPIPHRLNEH